MTPSQELAAMQDPGEKGETIENGTDDQPSSTNAFRVKAVSEINQNAANAAFQGPSFENSQTYGKRKLPSWMTTSNDLPENGKDRNEDNSNKRIKSSDFDVNVGCASSSNAETAECPINEEEQPDSVDCPSSSSSILKKESLDDSDRNADPSAAAEHNDTTNPVDETTVECPLNEEEQPDSVECPSSSSSAKTVVVKTESLNESDGNADPQTSAAAQTNDTTNPADVKPAVSVKKEEATSTTRESCKFGIRCYRRNPMHRIEAAHPGDHDYKRPNFPTPPKGTPDCPYGDSCYRRNPTHFQQFSHPPGTDFEQNWKNRLRQRRQAQTNSTTNNDDNSDLDDYDLDDPFIDDGDDEYIPSDDDEDYDECDKAEE